MALRKFEGTGVAIVTPFRKDESVDFKSLENVVNHLLKGKVEYLVVLGTTGESVTLNQDEKSAVVSFVTELVDGRVPVVVGIGGNNTQEVVNRIRATDFSRIDAVLSVAPYYNKPGQKGLYLHFRSIAVECPVPVIIYNVPGRTSSNISAETTVRLAHDFSNIVATKEASGNFSQIMQIMKNRPKDFLVLSGDDGIALPMIACGGNGVISVVANALPLEFSTMVRHALDGRFEEARKVHYRLLEFIDLLFAEGNPAGIKAAVSSLNLISNHLRLPLVPVSKQLNSSIASRLEEILKG